MKDKLTITAYEVVEQPMPIRTASRGRDWIDGLSDRFAYRCLPLAMANQIGQTFAGHQTKVQMRDFIRRK